MSTAELNQIKLNLIAWINQLSDTEVISFLEGVRKSIASTEQWEDLPETQRRIIINGLNDAQNNRFVNTMEFWEKLKNVR